VVLDEFGGFSGVGSLEDALELVVGEIEDEFDQDLSAAASAVEGGWSVPGHLSLRRLEVLLHRPLQRPTGVDSVGGLTSHVLSDRLQDGATAEWDGVQLEVESTEAGRATRVVVRVLPPAEPPTR
jgi:CBS domain containing-hemolysin-like protein